MKDFTLDIYDDLIKIILSRGYTTITFEELIRTKLPKSKFVCLRHDVDRLPKNALMMAQIENQLNVSSTYFFRSVKSVWNKEIINKVKSLDHEIAYHYEDLTIAKGDYKKAIDHFDYQLKRFRKIYPSKTICMHGSPLSKWDNKKLWDKYNYKDFGIIGEPYFDVDYSEIFYITDTGRQWNNETSNVRDIVNNSFNITINSTDHLIMLFKENKLPDKVMINTHPHRWFNYGLNWYKELIGQNIKNVAKSLIVKFR